ncbi:MAG TPA: hypothetical protein VLJ62_28745 [Burkholderiaceae bacterium]|nr:hypothetical protein [Burkholderiaceae bacterium]
MTFTWPSANKQAPIRTCWRADEIMVTQCGEVIDRLRARRIERVTLVHAGEGESPNEVRAALIQTAGRTVLLGAASGIGGRVLFERQAYWAQRNCIYWVAERCVDWPAVFGASRWPFACPRLPLHCTLTHAVVSALLDRAELTGPHTWEQRKQHRIERRRPFRGQAIAARLGCAGWAAGAANAPSSAGNLR